MGCVTGKLVDCMQTDTNTEELFHVMRTAADCYLDVNSAYKVFEDVTPRLTSRLIAHSKPAVSLQDLKNKDFNVFSLSADSLIICAAEVIAFASFNSSKLLSVLDLFGKNYHQTVPFHNFWHAFSVMQAVFVIGERNEQLRSFVNQEEFAVLLMAALGHDVCHPGLNNSYLIATKHGLADTYANVAVLENHHAAVTCAILQQSGLFEKNQFEQIRPFIVEAILSTDMARHNACFTEFEHSIQNYNRENKAHRQQFCNFLLHCADLGNQTLDFSLASVWSLKIVQEFNFQVTCEEKAKVKVSEFMRIGNNLGKIKSSQVGFINTTILPIWNSLSLNVPNIEDFVDSIRKNKIKWEEIQSFENT
jgi:hypothetical protein